MSTTHFEGAEQHMQGTPVSHTGISHTDISSHTPNWSPSSWRQFPARHQPIWPDIDQLESVTDQLKKLPPLVFAKEIRSLTDQLARVANGEAFLLQAGDCAESFDTSTNSIRDKLRVILQMAVVLTYSGGLPIVKIGRIAGQFAKPRSSNTETVNNKELPSFLGHMVNDIDFEETARKPNATRLLTSYNRAASTLNLLRAFTKGGYASLSHVSTWNRDFISTNATRAGYAKLANEIDKALRFMTACGVTSENTPQLNEIDFYTSHEALVLNFEEALTRQDSLTGKWYDCSAHLLWLGERTRQPENAHVEFLRGINNPLGCKIGPTAKPHDVVSICELLNPHNIPGRLTLIIRVGAKRVRDVLPPILEAVRNNGHHVVWACDPMHGNTYKTENGTKTRHFDDILAEITGFFAAHKEVGTFPGGIHLELTGDNVTECVGGSENIQAGDLGQAFETLCDPRLNGKQAVDLAFRVSEMLTHVSD